MYAIYIINYIHHLFNESKNEDLLINDTGEISKLNM